MCEAYADELIGWLKEQAGRGHDLVDAYRILHSESPRNRRLAMLASNLIPFSVYFEYLSERREDVLAALWTRTSVRQPVHVRWTETYKVDAEALFRVATSRAGLAAWTKAVEESPVRVRPGWGSPITISYADENQRGVITVGDDGRPPEVHVRIVLTPAAGGARLEMLIEERLIKTDVRPGRRKARLVEWWLEVVLPELLHLVEAPQRASRLA